MLKCNGLAARVWPGDEVEEFPSLIFIDGTEIFRSTALLPESDPSLSSIDSNFSKLFSTLKPHRWRRGGGTGGGEHEDSLKVFLLKLERLGIRVPFRSSVKSFRRSDLSFFFGSPPAAAAADAAAKSLLDADR